MSASPSLTGCLKQTTVFGEKLELIFEFGAFRQLFCEASLILKEPDGSIGNWLAIFNHNLVDMMGHQHLPFAGVIEMTASQS